MTLEVISGGKIEVFPFKSAERSRRPDMLYPQEKKIYVINEIKVGEDLIPVVTDQQHQILGAQKTIYKDRSTKISDFKRAEYEEYEIY